MVVEYQNTYEQIGQDTRMLASSMIIGLIMNYKSIIYIERAFLVNLLEKMSTFFVKGPFKKCNKQTINFSMFTVFDLVNCLFIESVGRAFPTWAGVFQITCTS